MALNDVLKVDIAFDGDLKISPTGDLDTMDGLTNLREAILRRILTIPGSLTHRPTYGCGLVAFQNAPTTLSVKRQLSNRIADQLPNDPRIASVESVSISSTDDSPESLKIVVKVVAVSIGDVTFTFTPFAQLVV